MFWIQCRFDTWSQCRFDHRFSIDSVSGFSAILVPGFRSDVVPGFRADSVLRFNVSVPARVWIQNCESVPEFSAMSMPWFRSKSVFGFSANMVCGKNDLVSAAFRAIPSTSFDQNQPCSLKTEWARGEWCAWEIFSYFFILKLSPKPKSPVASKLNELESHFDPAVIKWSTNIFVVVIKIKWKMKMSHWHLAESIHRLDSVDTLTVPTRFLDSVSQISNSLSVYIV